MEMASKQKGNQQPRNKNKERRPFFFWEMVLVSEWQSSNLQLGSKKRHMHCKGRQKKRAPPWWVVAQKRDKQTRNRKRGFGCVCLFDTRREYFTKKVFVVPH
jgi:hypothetical protein